MGTATSSKYVEEAQRRLHSSPMLWLRIKLAGVFKRWRLFRLKFGSHAVIPSHAEPRISEQMDKGAEHYQKNGWVFVENILNKDFHAELVKNWPKKYYFDPPRELAKSYNTGFAWSHGGEIFKYSDPYGQHQTFRKFIDYLRSKEFCERVRHLNGAEDEMILYSFIANDAEKGAEVIPHQDGNRFDSRAKTFLNMIFFLNATGGTNSGGLTLSRDNEMKDIIFEPKNLINTCLIYDIIGDFYHGFPPIAPGKFRWVITAQYCQKDYVQKK